MRQHVDGGGLITIPGHWCQALAEPVHDVEWLPVRAVPYHREDSGSAWHLDLPLS
jgi:hypothetical protein